MLTENQIREFKKILENRYYQLREEIRLELLETDEQPYIELAGQVHDIGEASVADLLVDLQLAEIDREVREIRDIDAALLRIAAGEYGLCTDCQASIDEGRLRAYPTAKRCYRCQVSYEHNHARDSGPSM
ncbi:MAG TPA: TraR/DksA C4-type zinc finger protein [Xanthomonadales bacterium]